MLGAIANIAKLKEAIAKADTTRFNSTLPISIKVLKKLDKAFYQLQLGNKEYSTKSLKELEVGGKYWGDFNKSKEGIINISNLIKKPKMLQKGDFVLQFNEKALLELIQTKDPKGVLKSLILEQLSTAKSKNEFMQLTNMLIALEDGIFTIPYKDDGINAVLQYKKSKKNKSNNKSNSIEFYAAFDNLGPIDGKLYLYDDTLKGDISCKYSKTASLLDSIKDELSFDINLSIGDEVSPLSELDSSLLDLKC